MEKKIIILLLILLFFSVFSKYGFSEYRNVNYKKYPLLNTYDGYRFLRWAEDMVNGKYRFNQIDSLKNLSCDYKYDFYPLISLVLAGIGKIFGSIGMNVASVWLPVFFSMFAPLLLFFIFYRYYSWKSGLISYLFFYTSEIYYLRTDIGRYDTDMLILFWIILIGLLFLYGFERFNRKYIYYGIASYYLFMWWYPKSDFSVLFILGIMMYVFYFYIKNKSIKKDHLNFFLIILLFFLPFIIYSIVSSIDEHIQAYKINIYSGIVKGAVPLSATITEAKSVGLIDSINMISPDTVFFILAVLGIVLFYKKLRLLFFFLPLFAIGVLSFKMGARFLMYLVPILSFGIGYLFVFIENRMNIANVNKYIKMGVFLFFLIGSISVDPILVYSKPVFSERITKDMYIVKNKIKEKGFLYNWWDTGDFLQLTLRMPTLMDNEGNGSKGGRYYFYTYSLASDNIDTLLYIVDFLKSVKGEEYDSVRVKYKDIKNSLLSGKIEYTKDTTDMYMVFLSNMLSSSKSIFYMAGIFCENDVMKKSYYKRFYLYKQTDSLWIGNGIVLNMNRGELNIGNRNYPIKRLLKVTNDNYFLEKEWDNDPGYTIEYIVLDSGYISDFLIMNELVYESNFNKIFILGEKSEKYDFVFRDLPYVCVVKID